jgi:hypothetical protein
MGDGILWESLLNYGKSLDDLFGRVLEIGKMEGMWDGNITPSSDKKVVFGIGLRFILFNLFEAFVELIIFGNRTTAIPYIIFPMVMDSKRLNGFFSYKFTKCVFGRNPLDRGSEDMFAE